MSTRLQVLLPGDEMDEIRKAALSENLSVGEWVRQSLRVARHRKARGNPEAKLAIVRQASRLAYPTAEVGKMLGEIEQGYQ